MVVSERQKSQRAIPVTAPDSDGKLQPARREISKTKKITGDVEETKTTVS